MNRSGGTTTRIPWWKWCRWLGWIAFAGVLTVGGSLLCGRLQPGALNRWTVRFALGLALHLAFDFTFQTSRMAAHKATNRRWLLLHALAAGGIPGFVAGLPASPFAAALGGAYATSHHFLVDCADKFGFGSHWPGPLLDQALHILTLAMVSTL